MGIKVAQDGVVRWPGWLNKGLDCDVIVSEGGCPFFHHPDCLTPKTVRETSRKPDELYGMIERCCPSGRKVELFGRRHNGRDGWLTLGNQIGEDVVHDEALAERLNARCVWCMRSVIQQVYIAKYRYPEKHTRQS